MYRSGLPARRERETSTISSGAVGKRALNGRVYRSTKMEHHVCVDRECDTEGRVLLVGESPTRLAFYGLL